MLALFRNFQTTFQLLASCAVRGRQRPDTTTIRHLGLLGMIGYLVGTPVLAVAADSAVVLMYHRFAEDKYPSTSIRLDQFDAQLEHLEENGSHVIPLADLLAAFSTGADLPERAVVIPIDDADRSI